MKGMLDELQGLSLSVVEQFNQSHWAAEDLSANDAHGLSDVSRAFCERFVWRLCAGKALMSILSIWEFSRISSQPHVKVRPRFFSCICLQIKVRL